VKRASTIIAISGAALALAVGLAVGRLGGVAVVALLGLGIAGAAFAELRVTLLAIVPAMVLLPELPLAVPLRTEDLLMAPLVAAWLARLALGRERWPATPMNAPIFAIAAIELAALLWGAIRGTAGLTPELYSASFFFLKTVEVAFLYFIVVSALRQRRDVWLFAAVLCVAFTALGLWGVIEHQTGPAGEPITGPAGLRGYSLLGLTLVVALAFIGSLILTVRANRARLALSLAALPVGAALLFTLSRQSYVGAAAAVVTLVWVRNRKLIIPVLILAVALPRMVPDVVQRRAASIVAAAPDPVTGITPYATRVHALQRRLPEVIGGSPLLGFGPAALPPGFLDNQYLLTLYYTGIIGVIAFIWLLWRAFRTAQRGYRALDGPPRGLALAWLAATVGLAVAGLAGSPFVAVRARQVYWFVAALAVAAYQVYRATADETGERRVATEPGA